MTDHVSEARRGRPAALFHRLNNQLGVILAHAELLETKAADDGAARPRDAGGQRGTPGHGRRTRNSTSIAEPE